MLAEKPLFLFLVIGEFQYFFEEYSKNFLKQIFVVDNSEVVGAQILIS
jgi:hypothetical protein